MMSTPSNRRKIFVVDDQCLVREGLIKIINRQKDLLCCGVAEGVVAAEKAVPLLKPNLVVVDLLLTDGCGLEITKNLTSQFPSLYVLIVSQCDETLYAERALKAGARGYVMKSRSVSEILAAIRAVLNGEFYVSAKIAAIALSQMAERRTTNSHQGPGNLTNRELQVFQLLGAGIGTRDISKTLHLSIKTIETHRENIKHKLKFSTAAELTRYATKWVERQGPIHQIDPEAS